MADAWIEASKQRAAQLQGRYQLRFADKPRATRELSELDMLIKESEALVSELAERGASGLSLRETIQGRVAMYQDERKEIVAAYDAGDQFAEAALLGTRANFMIAKYHRHFAGQDRRTRDVGLLSELVSELESIQRAMARLVATEGVESLRGDLEVVTENLALYATERDRVEQAQAQGTGDERASLLANLANRQFQLYKLHFAGESRATRRQPLLERIIGELDRVAEAMAGLSAAGEGGETNMKNAGIVAERTAFYRKELDQVRGTQAAATAFARVEALGREADELIDVYNSSFAGQDRATRDTDRLNLLCDQLGEVEAQLTTLIDRYDLGPRHAPTGLVRDALGMFENEYHAVRQAKLH